MSNHSPEGRTLWVETVRDRLLSGEQVRVPSTLFLVRRPRQEVGANAGSYVKCELGDQTGWIDAIWWGAGKLPRQQLEALLAADVWVVEGLAALNRYGGRETPQIKMESARPLAGADLTSLEGLIRRSSSSEEDLAEWLEATIASVRNEHLRLLLQDTVGIEGPWHASFLRVQAGLHHHHAYVGGLVDHVREMASMWLSSCSIFPQVDRDLTLTGVFLHDVGKIDTFAPGPAPQLARAGRYLDHITAGIARISLALEGHPQFPPVLREHLLHIIASHHGLKEHGSPVEPATREAIVVHHLDRLSSLLSHLEEWTKQSGIDQHGWTTDRSPWLKVNLAASPVIPGAAAEEDHVDL